MIVHQLVMKAYSTHKKPCLCTSLLVTVIAQGVMDLRTKNTLESRSLVVSTQCGVKGEVLEYFNLVTSKYLSTSYILEVSE